MVHQLTYIHTYFDRAAQLTGGSHGLDDIDVYTAVHVDLAGLQRAENAIGRIVDRTQCLGIRHHAEGDIAGAKSAEFGYIRIKQGMKMRRTNFVRRILMRYSRGWGTGTRTPTT
jgi:hypothetical protein